MPPRFLQGTFNFTEFAAPMQQASLLLFAGVVVASLFVSFALLAFCWRCRKQKGSLWKTANSTKGPICKLQHRLLHHFSYRALKKATKDFHPKNQLGGGGFGPVYKVDLSFYSSSLSLSCIQDYISWTGSARWWKGHCGEATKCWQIWARRVRIPGRGQNVDEHPTQESRSPHWVLLGRLRALARLWVHDQRKLEWDHIWKEWEMSRLEDAIWNHCWSSAGIAVPAWGLQLEDCS